MCLQKKYYRSCVLREEVANGFSDEMGRGTKGISYEILSEQIITSYIKRC